ncbi:MAG: hypothetical protein NTX50_25285 [Candidatus Sumerlaeota bacterium]|nr:hypothetical protein [Candidatus Sumerlaeota bacterium]
MAVQKATGICTCGSNQLAFTRCGRCAKPVCEQCKVERNGEAYCSLECAEVAQRYLASEGKSIPRSRPVSIWGAIFGLLCFAVIAWLAWWLYFSGPGPDQLRKMIGI